MEHCRGKIKTMAKEAMQRMSSGFWANEYEVRNRRLSLIEQNGKDKTEAVKFFVAETKAHLKRENHTDDELYLKVRRMFLSGCEKNIMAALIDRTELEKLDDAGRQRYIFDLSDKLQEYRKRFNTEQEYGLQDTAI